MRIRLALLALVVVFAGALVWLGVRIAKQNDRIATLEGQLRTALSRPLPAPAAVQTPAAVHQDEHRAAPPDNRRVVIGPPDNAEADRLNAKLQESQAALARVQGRVEELELKILEMTADRTRIANAESEAREQIAQLNHKLEQLSAERPGWEKRIRDLEAENVRLRDQGTAVVQRSTQVGKLLAEWQDLSQRQQVYLTNTLRRYRELTDLFRRMPGMVEVKGNGPELLRIQTAISMADEDLRQLNDLSVRLGRVQKQVAAAR